MDSDSNTENVPVKKKRGRKPKNKDKIEEPKIPKKRGRKPTGKIISLKSNEMSSLKQDENCIIAHIPLKQSDIEKLSSSNSKNESSLSEVENKISSIIDENSENSDTELSITEMSLENNELGNKKKNFWLKFK